MYPFCEIYLRVRSGFKKKKSEKQSWNQWSWSLRAAFLYFSIPIIPQHLPRPMVTSGYPKLPYCITHPSLPYLLPALHITTVFLRITDRYQKKNRFLKLTHTYILLYEGLASHANLFSLSQQNVKSEYLSCSLLYFQCLSAQHTVDLQ